MGLLVGAAFKVIPLELVVSSMFLVCLRWVVLLALVHVSRLVLFR